MSCEIGYERPAGGQGSRFVVTIPAESAGRAVRASQSFSKAAAQQDRTGVPFPGRQRVLLAEDNADNRLLVQAFLKSSGLRLEFAENGREAVERFEAAAAAGQSDSGFDLILMDIQMPELDGYAATRAVRAFEEEWGRAPTPVIALTANATADDMRRSMAAGCSEHLSKPILKQVLLDALHRHLDPNP